MTDEDKYFAQKWLNEAKYYNLPPELRKAVFALLEEEDIYYHQGKHFLNLLIHLAGWGATIYFGLLLLDRLLTIIMGH